MMRYLSFIVLTIFLLGSCTNKVDQNPIQIVWENDKAVEIELTSETITQLPEEKIGEVITVELGDAGQPMLGSIFKRSEKVVFRPIIPFTRGMHYHVLLNGVIYSEFDIPRDENSKPPQLTIYPSTDTVPENILKLYFQFTEPMVEGSSLSHIFVLNERGDTLKNTFLDLQPELWNTAGNLLTIWFDPGRVKRDLIPNKELGNPIEKGQWYSLIIDGNWKSKSGNALDKEYYKHFFVTIRDELKPEIKSWEIIPPNSSTTNDLRINFTNPLDYSLILSVIQIVYPNGEIIPGLFKSINNEKSILFTPQSNWIKGSYIVRVESRLEDLAGNNLERLFERDLTKGDDSLSQEKFEISFSIP